MAFYRKWLSIFACISLFCGKQLLLGDDFEKIAINQVLNLEVIGDETILYLRPNTTQLFTELYQKYGLLNNPPLNVIERVLYLDQVGAPTPFPLQPADRAILDYAESILQQFQSFLISSQHF